MEKVINDQNAATELGVPLGQKPRPFPGLAPVSHRLAELQSEVTRLEAAKYELDQIRATILVNFGPLAPRNFGLTLADTSVSTLALVLATLEHFVLYTPLAKPKE